MPCCVLAGGGGANAEADALERQLTAAGLGTTPEFEFAQNMRAFPPAKHDALGLEELLTPAEREVRDRVRRFAVSGAGGHLVALGWLCHATPNSSLPHTAPNGLPSRASTAAPRLIPAAPPAGYSTAPAGV